MEFKISFMVTSEFVESLVNDHYGEFNEDDLRRQVKENNEYSVIDDNKNICVYTEKNVLYVIKYLEEQEPELAMMISPLDDEVSFLEKCLTLEYEKFENE